MAFHEFFATVDVCAHMKQVEVLSKTELRAVSFHRVVMAVLGSLEHPLVNLDLSGSLTADGGSSVVLSTEVQGAGPGGGSGGSLLLFLETLTLQNGSLLTTAGGDGGPIGGGGGAGGRVHFHWSNIPVGEDYTPIASVKGDIHSRYLRKSVERIKKRA